MVRATMWVRREAEGRQRPRAARRRRPSLAICAARFLSRFEI